MQYRGSLLTSEIYNSYCKKQRQVHYANLQNIINRECYKVGKSRSLCCIWPAIMTINYKKDYDNVRRIVALITMLHIQAGLQIRAGPSFLNGSSHILTFVPIFLCVWRIKPTYSQPIKHAKKYGINIFDYEGLNLWDTE